MSTRTDSAATPTRRKRPLLKWIGGLLALLLLAVVGVAGYIGYNAQRSFDEATGGKGGSVADMALPGRAPTASAAAGASGAQTATASDRVNILIVGNAEDDPNHPGAEMTDGIMVASIDPATHKTHLISVPRDIFVVYNGQPMKLNAVYYFGGTGVAGLEALGHKVTEITGLPISSHVRVANNAFRDIVNDIGGVDVFIQTGDPRGLADPNQNLYLPAGVNHLDAETAMKLASARGKPVPGKEVIGIPNSDYSREQFQQLLLKSIAAQIKHDPRMANPLTIVNLFNSLARNLRTDLTVSNIKWLYEQQQAMQGEPRSISLRDGLFDDYKVPADQQAKASEPIVDAVAPTSGGVFDYAAVHRYVAEQLTK